MAFIYTSKNGAKLTPSQEELLETIENLPSPYEGITKLKDLRNITGLSVVVSDRKSLVRMLEKYIEQYRKEMGKFFSSGIEYHRNQGPIAERIKWAEEQLIKAKEPGEGTSPLLGLYSRKLQWYKNDAPIVYLFADNINDYASKVGQSPDFVFGYVLIHEMMHAYYDAFNSIGNPAVYSLEEPFAEFGMLTFLNQNKSILSGILRDAIDHVLAKINNGPREYGFGLEIFRRAGGDAVDMVKRYRDISNWLDSFGIHALNKESDYYDCIRKYIKDASEINAERCYESILDILDYDWKKPIYSIQPSINPLSRSRASAFYIPVTPGAKGSKPHHKYDIIEIATGNFIARDVPMNRVALNVIKDYCSKNKSLDFSALQKLFSSIRPYKLPKGMDIIMHKWDIEAYHSGRSDSRWRYIKDTPVVLSTGDYFFVTDQWTSDGNLIEFIAIAKTIGYEVRCIL